MLGKKRLGITVLLLSCCYAGPRDVRATFDWLKKGAALTADQARELEQRLVTAPADEESRIELLSYYGTRDPATDLAAVKRARAAHIFWLIEHDPKTGLGLFQVGTGVFRLHCTGDKLADWDAFRHATDLWIAQVRQQPRDTDIRRAAAEAIQYCSPEQAETLLHGI